jgi:hypothetical protein
MNQIARTSTGRALRLREPTFAELFDVQGGLCGGCRLPERAVDRWGAPLRLQVYINTAVKPTLFVLVCKSCTIAMAEAREDPDTLGRLRELLLGQGPLVSSIHEVRLHLASETEREGGTP